jgi:hypothetical protein
MTLSENDWDGISMEEWVESMLRQGYTAIVSMMIKTLPESKKERYREIYRKIKEEKEKNGNP